LTVSDYKSPESEGRPQGCHEDPDFSHWKIGPIQSEIGEDSPLGGSMDGLSCHPLRVRRNPERIIS